MTSFMCAMKQPQCVCSLESHYGIHRLESTSNILFHIIASRDYIASNQTLTFTAPERKCIRIEIVDDSEVERNEEFRVYLTLPTDTGRQVLSRCGSVRIADNDGKKEVTCMYMLHEPLNECSCSSKQSAMCSVHAQLRCLYTLSVCMWVSAIILCTIWSGWVAIHPAETST